MKRTIIDISRDQAELDFEEAELSQPFTFPEYQRNLISDRFLADLIDMGIVAAVYVVFITMTYLQMPGGASVDRLVAGIYTIGFLLLVSFAAQVVLGAVLEFAQERIPIPPLVVTVINLAVALALATLVFATIFKVLPDVRLQWRDTWTGALFTAVLFVLGQGLISLYLTRAAPASTYGAAGALVLVLLWVYYSALILFLGAAFVRAFVRSRGDVIPPKRTAVKVRTEVVEDREDPGRMVASERE